MSNNIPTFTTDRLILRPIRLSDVESYERHFVDYEVISHLAASVPWPYPEGGVAEYLANVMLPPQGSTQWTWGLFLKEDTSELIGCVDLWREGRPEHRGFWLGRKFWNQGLMTEAVVPVLEYAFAGLGFEKLLFSNALGNTKSRRIKEKTGARLLYVKPAKFVNPAYTECEVWELTKEEWDARKRIK